MTLRRYLCLTENFGALFFLERYLTSFSCSAIEIQSVKAMNSMVKEVVMVEIQK